MIQRDLCGWYVMQAYGKMLRSRDEVSSVSERELSKNSRSVMFILSNMSNMLLSVSWWILYFVLNYIYDICYIISMEWLWYVKHISLCSILLFIFYTFHINEFNYAIIVTKMFLIESKSMALNVTCQLYS